MGNHDNPCIDCGCYDCDMGCTMPSMDRAYACPLEADVYESYFLSYEDFVAILDKINNMAVGFIEGGPYEDANSVALDAMRKIDDLSQLQK